MNLPELVEECRKNICDSCDKETKECCRQFKVIMEGIKEPWEMTRLLELGKAK